MVCGGFVGFAGFSGFGFSAGFGEGVRAGGVFFGEVIFPDDFCAASGFVALPFGAGLSVFSSADAVCAGRLVEFSPFVSDSLALSVTLFSAGGAMLCAACLCPPQPASVARQNMHRRILQDCIFFIEIHLLSVLSISEYSGKSSENRNFVKIAYILCTTPWSSDSASACCSSSACS